MNGNQTLRDLEDKACSYGIAARAVQEERDYNVEKRLDNMEEWIGKKLDGLESRVNKFYLTLLPNTLTLIGIVITILMLIKK